MSKKIQQAELSIQQGKVNPDKLIKLLQPLIKKKDTPWKAYHITGVAYFLKKEFGKAESFFDRALESESGSAEVYFFKGRCRHLLQDPDEAVTHLKRAVQIYPDYIDAWMKLGELHKETGKLNEALKCYGQCNRIDPRKAEVAMKIGGIYRDQGFLEKALEMFTIVLKMEPENISALNEKAKLYKTGQNYEKAEQLIREAIEIDSINPNLRATHAEILKESGDFLQALDIYKKMLQDNPNFGGARVNYANILQALGRFDEAEKNYLRANRDTPSFQETYSNYLFMQHYNPEKTKEEMLAALKKWDSIYAPESPKRPVPEDREKEKKLRIGLVSGGFRKHPVGWMIVAGLENLDQEKFELYFYSNHTQVDEVTKRLHKTSAEWRMISGFSDQKVNEMIREDQIDILVELSGHAAESRLRAVAMEPAPVIVKWVGGLINTTGLKAIDYLLTDWIETPEGVDSEYVEKLVRMPDDYICFTPPADSPEVNESPFKESGFITFGCFNNPIKVNPVLLEKWAVLMNQVPESRLFLKSKQYGNEFYSRRIEALMQGFGIPKERLIFEGYSPHHQLLEAYNRVDIALDPWPYSGGLTTCEALWMGVPVITYPGPTFAGRHAASHVHNAGYPEWIAESWEEYIQKVVELVADREALAKVRDGLRDKVAASPLCNGARFGAALGAAFLEMWVAYAEGRLKKDAIAVEVPAMNTSEESLEVRGDRMDEFLDSHPFDPEEFVADTEEAWYLPLLDGTRLCVPPTIANPVSHALLEKQQWYEPEIEFLKNYLKPGMSVLELNASYGMFSVPMALAVGKEGRVNVWVEKRKDRAFLLKSAHLNNLENIVALDSDASQKCEIDDVDVLIISDVDQFNNLRSTQPKVVLFNKPLSDEATNMLFEVISETGFRPYLYIDAVGILTEIGIQDIDEPHITRIVAVSDEEVDNLTQRGIIFNSGESLSEPETDYWKGRLSEMLWTESVRNEWESLPTGEAVSLYIQALNWALQGTDKENSGSYRASALLKSTGLLIDLFNTGFIYRPVSLTLVRVLNDLGKRGQALSVLQKVMQTKADAEENKLSLPFLPVLEMQETVPVRESFTNWLTVRTIEAWIMLNNFSMNSADQDTLKLLAALHNNPEASAQIERMYHVATMRSNGGFFSQFGEDKILDEILTPSRKKGFYVDVGAFDPMKYSNTLRMNLFGWEGVNVDANEGSIKKFNRVRPNDKNIYAAVTEINGTVNFFKADKLGEVNTLSAQHRKKWQKRGISYDAVQVPSRRLEDILDEVVPEGQEIDFMSIDVEEAEMGVLNSNNWKKYKPRHIAIEIHDFDSKNPKNNEVARTVLNLGCQVLGQSGPTVIFGRIES